MGVSNIQLITNNHPLFSEFGEMFQAYSSHYNQIKIEGVNVLSSHSIEGGEFVQAFEIQNASNYGVQFHPELTYEEYLPLIETYKDLLEEDLGLSIDQIQDNLFPIPSNKNILKNLIENTHREK